jgi:predicted nucleic-acid-binding protein
MANGSLDTNVLLRLLLNDIPHQHDAVKRLVAQRSGLFSVADTAIIELAFALGKYYGLARPQIAEAITGLMQLEEINCNHQLFEKVIPLFVNYPALSFEDCCLATYARLNGAEPLWTFDKKLANQAPGVRLVQS